MDSVTFAAALYCTLQYLREGGLFEEKGTSTKKEKKRTQRVARKALEKQKYGQQAKGKDFSKVSRNGEGSRPIKQCWSRSHP